MGVDSEEFVVERVLDCFSSLTDFQLLEKYALKELVSTSIPLLCHPSIWIRHAAVGFLTAFSRLFPLDMQCIFFPMLKPFFMTDKRFSISDVSLLENLKVPVFESMLLIIDKPRVV
jgi:phosphoinositide-3-kinase regulatory subunit 4